MMLGILGIEQNWLTRSHCNVSRYVTVSYEVFLLTYDINWVCEGCIGRGEAYEIIPKTCR